MSLAALVAPRPRILGSAASMGVAARVAPSSRNRAKPASRSVSPAARPDSRKGSKGDAAADSDDGGYSSMSYGSDRDSGNDDDSDSDRGIEFKKKGAAKRMATQQKTRVAMQKQVRVNKKANTVRPTAARDDVNLNRSEHYRDVLCFLHLVQDGGLRFFTKLVPLNRKGKPRAIGVRYLDFPKSAEIDGLAFQCWDSLYPRGRNPTTGSSWAIRIQAFLKSLSKEINGDNFLSRIDTALKSNEWREPATTRTALISVLTTNIKSLEDKLGACSAAVLNQLWVQAKSLQSKLDFELISASADETFAWTSAAVKSFPELSEYHGVYDRLAKPPTKKRKVGSSKAPDVNAEGDVGEDDADSSDDEAFDDVKAPPRKKTQKSIASSRPAEKHVNAFAVQGAQNAQLAQEVKADVGRARAEEKLVRVDSSTLNDATTLSLLKNAQSNPVNPSAAVPTQSISAAPTMSQSNPPAINPPTQSNPISAAPTMSQSNPLAQANVLAQANPLAQANALAQPSNSRMDGDTSSTTKSKGSPTPMVGESVRSATVPAASSTPGLIVGAPKKAIRGGSSSPTNHRTAMEMLTSAGAAAAAKTMTAMPTNSAITATNPAPTISAISSISSMSSLGKIDTRVDSTLSAPPSSSAPASAASHAAPAPPAPTASASFIATSASPAAPAAPAASGTLAPAASVLAAPASPAASQPNISLDQPARASASAAAVTPTNAANTMGSAIKAPVDLSVELAEHKALVLTVQTMSKDLANVMASIKDVQQNMSEMLKSMTRLGESVVKETKAAHRATFEESLAKLDAYINTKVPLLMDASLNKYQRQLEDVLGNEIESVKKIDPTVEIIAMSTKSNNVLSKVVAPFPAPGPSASASASASGPSASAPGPLVSASAPLVATASIISPLPLRHETPVVNRLFTAPAPSVASLLMNAPSASASASASASSALHPSNPTHTTPIFSAAFSSAIDSVTMRA